MSTLSLFASVYFCVSVCVEASTVYQEGGVDIPAITEEGLGNICACANTTRPLCAHILMNMPFHM